MAKPESDSLKSAVALTYSQTDLSPRVVAKGRGLIAEQIISRAREHGIYVHEFRRSSTSRWRNCWPGSIASKTVRPSPPPPYFQRFPKHSKNNCVLTVRPLFLI